MNISFKTPEEFVDADESSGSRACTSHFHRKSGPWSNWFRMLVICSEGILYKRYQACDEVFPTIGLVRMNEDAYRPRWLGKVCLMRNSCTEVYKVLRCGSLWQSDYQLAKRPENKGDCLIVGNSSGFQTVTILSSGRHYYLCKNAGGY